MEKNAPLFADFSPVTKKSWLAQIEKDLKGRSPEEFEWQIAENLRMSPFIHAEDYPATPPPITDERVDNRWEIGEDYEWSSLAGANEALRDGLLHGVQAPRLLPDKVLEPGDLQALLQGVELSYISLHFAGLPGQKELAAQVGHWLDFLEKNSIESGPLRGSFSAGMSEDATPALAKALLTASERIPHFRLLTVDLKAQYDGPESAIAELQAAVRTGDRLLREWQEHGLSPAAIHRQLQFSFAIGASYFLQIAKLRAFRLLWTQVMLAYELPEEAFPPVEAHLAPATQTDDQHTNMIRATTQAMSAAIGGADRLTILPGDAFQGRSTDFARRIARNVQHILQMESHLDQVVDPAAGSYYIEILTEKLARAAWER